MMPGRLAVLVAALAIASCEAPVHSPAEVAQRVRDDAAWMSDAKQCPADVMHSQMRVSSLLPARSCKGAGLPSCFAPCRNGDVYSCYWLAYEVQQSKLDDQVAEALFQRACILGEPSGCTNRAAGMLKASIDDSAVRNCAARTFLRTCELDDSWGCTMLGLARHQGFGGAQDDARALEALHKACRVGREEESCTVAQSLIKEIEGAH